MNRQRVPAMRVNLMEHGMASCPDDEILGRAREGREEKMDHDNARRRLTYDEIENQTYFKLPPTSLYNQVSRAN